MNPPTVASSELDATPPLIRRRPLALAALVATAALMVLAFPDGDQDYLAWIALVPFFCVARGAGGKKGFLIGWLAGALIEAGGFGWILHAIREFSELPFVVAAIFFLAWLAYSSLSWAILGALLGRCGRAAHAHWAVLAWVGVELVFPRLFPWQLGGAFYHRDWLRQGADLIGASGLSYLMLLGNLLVLLLVEWKVRGRPFPVRTAIAVAALVVFCNAYGAWRLADVRRRAAELPQVTVGVLQPFADPLTKGGRDEATSRDYYLGLLRGTRELAQDPDVDLVLWIEGADPVHVLDPTPGGDPLARYRDQGPLVFDRLPVPLVIGATSVAPGDAEGSRPRVWNTAAYIRPRGASDDDGAGSARTTAQLYHKRRRLLFGEYVPFESWLPEALLDRVFVGTIEAGHTSPLMELDLRGAGATPSVTFRTLICYEAVLPGFFRKQARGADLLVNVTEDIWYGHTAHIRQHESVIRMRCVENRIGLVRCTNVGPSGALTADGGFEQRTAVWKPDRAVVSLGAGALFSPYARGGWLVPFAALGGLLYFFIKQNKQKG